MLLGRSWGKTHWSDINSRTNPSQPPTSLSSSFPSSPSPRSPLPNPLSSRWWFTTTASLSVCLPWPILLFWPSAARCLVLGTTPKSSSDRSQAFACLYSWFTWNLISSVALSSCRHWVRGNLPCLPSWNSSSHDTLSSCSSGPTLSAASSPFAPPIAFHTQPFLPRFSALPSWSHIARKGRVGRKESLPKYFSWFCVWRCSCFPSAWWPHGNIWWRHRDRSVPHSGSWPVFWECFLCSFWIFSHARVRSCLHRLRSCSRTSASPFPQFSAGGELQWSERAFAFIFWWAF